jgi:hypothetical protein
MFQDPRNSSNIPVCTHMHTHTGASTSRDQTRPLVLADSDGGQTEGRIGALACFFIILVPLLLSLHCRR